MPSPHSANRIFPKPRTACCARLALAAPDCSLGLTMAAIMSAWIAQVIFWQMAGWQISLRMNLSWILLPVGAYFFSSLAVASIMARTGNSFGRRIPQPLVACGWIALTIFFVSLSIRHKSIYLFSVSGALFGAGLFPLLRQATFFCQQRGQPKIALLIATLCGVALGMAATSGPLFINQHLLQLTIAFACCLAIALCATRVQTMLDDTTKKSVVELASKHQTSAFAASIKYAGCSVLMAAPLALAPTIEVLCGAKLASFGYGFLAHYGAMLLPSILGLEWQHTVSKYVLLTVYVTSVILGHIAPLLYLSGIDWFAVGAY